MRNKQFKYGAYLVLMVLAGCQSSGNKDSIKSIPQNDTAKTLTRKGSKKIIAGTFVVLDTLVNKDTLKVVLYRDSMIRCSLNNLSDTFNSSQSVSHWDSSFGDDGLIVIPGKKKLKSFILNDSLLIIPIGYGYMHCNGGFALFLLNRTKNSLKFTQANNDNPIIASSCPYVDMKNNNIITYYYHPYYDFEDAGQCQLDHARWLVDRYKIKDKKFVQTYAVAASSEKLDNIDVSAETDSAQMAFYAYMAHYKYWDRDRFDSSIYQRVVIFDTVAGKDTISVSYDNKGLITAVINRDTDTYDWDRTWIGSEWWRGKEDCKMIIPGGKRPVSCILNDTMLIISLSDLYRYASLFVLRRYHDSLVFINDQISTAANYVYVDVNKNQIIEQAGKISDDMQLKYKDPYSEKASYTLNRYKIQHNGFEQTDEAQTSLPELNDISNPDSYKSAKEFYNIVVHHEDWKKDRVPIKKKEGIIPQ